MTKDKIYYQDNSLVTFTATVEECKKEGERYAISLDRSAFYPEGGGQPCDLGLIGEIPVVHVSKGEEGPIHYTHSFLEPGSDVICRVDWDHRFDYMQQHTGQHILSALLVKWGNWSTVSVHQGEDYTSIELDTSDITDEELYKVERDVNRIIAGNTPVKTLWTTADELNKYPIRRPPKVTGEIRLVDIPGVDCVPCGGVHTSTTGEVGLVLYLGQEKIRGHIRTLWKIGERAFKQTTLNHQILTGLGTKYSVPPGEITKRLDIMEKDLLKKEGELRKLREELLSYKLEDLKGQIDHRGILTAAIEGEDKNFLQNAAISLLEEGCQLLVLVNRKAENLQWIVGTGNETEFEFSAFKDKILPLIEGKGGGRGPIWQGKGDNVQGLDSFFKALRDNYGH